MKKSVYIIVLTWNRCDLAVKCLKSLEGVKTRNKISLVLVDNNSTDSTIKTVTSQFPKVTILHNKQNLGWSGGNNVGIKYALKNKADFIVLLNNDITVDINFVDELIKTMEKYPEVGIASPKIYRSGGKSDVISNAGNFFNDRYFGIAKGSGEKDKGQFDNIFYTDFVSGVVCAKSNVYKKCGLLDERFFLYFEDAEFCVRAKKEGFQCVFVQTSHLYHEESATIGADSPQHSYYNARNHLLYLRTHESYLTLARELLIAVNQILRKVKHKNKNWKYDAWGLYDFLIGRFGNQKHWN